MFPEILSPLYTKFYFKYITRITIAAFLLLTFYIVKNRKDIKKIISDIPRSHIIFISILTIIGLMLRIKAELFIIDNIRDRFLYTAIARAINDTGIYQVCSNGMERCFPLRKPYYLYTTLTSILYTLKNNILQVPRILNIVAGTVTIPLSALTAKKYSKNKTTTLLFPLLITLLPLHIELSKTIETHAFDIFFILLTFLTLKLAKNHPQWFGVATFSSLFAVTSKYTSLLLIFPITFFLYKNKKRIKDYLKNPSFILSATYLIYIFPHYLWSINKLLRSSPTVKNIPSILSLERVMAHEIIPYLTLNTFNILIGGIIITGTFYAIYRKRWKKPLLLILTALALHLHFPNAAYYPKDHIRLWSPFLITGCFIGAEMLSDIIEKLKSDQKKTALILTIIIIGATFTSLLIKREPKEYLESGKKIKEGLEMYEDYKLITFKPYLVFTLTKRNFTIMKHENHNEKSKEELSKKFDILDQIKGKKVIFVKNHCQTTIDQGLKPSKIKKETIIDGYAFCEIK